MELDSKDFWVDISDTNLPKQITSVDDISSTDTPIGFVYMISNMVTDRSYIGKKQIISQTWTPVAKSTYEKLRAEGKVLVKKTKSKSKSKKGNPVWIYKRYNPVTSDWLTYTGSNKQLNEDIAKGHKIIKVILLWAFSKKELTYLETKMLFQHNVLENDHFYNDNILGTFFTTDLI